MKNYQPGQSIDVHAHYITDHYREAAIAAGHSKPDGMPAIPEWDVDNTLAVMDSIGIQTAMLSISSPGIHFGDDNAAKALARAINEEGAKIVSDHPGRFGLFASLPLPDMQNSLKELEYVMDELKVDGIVLETNFHGVYLGDNRLEELFCELNKRSAIVFIHPTSPSCTCCQSLALGYPRPMLEFMFETTRSVTNLILSGVTQSYSNVRIIVPHAGAALPVLIDRIAGLTPILGLSTSFSEAELFQEFKKLYFDLAGTPLPRLLPVLLTMANTDHILYGSDYPFSTEALVRSLMTKLENSNLDKKQLKAFMRDNALKLFPRLLD
ncbi:MAG: amidohydrolase 2 [Mucilaginibacter sp.]|nr:amidohydrolase 2 [Mucilaginibacter sp.]